MGLAVRATAVPQPYVVPPSQKFDGNDGSWSTFRISVGTPGQDFRVLPSTKSGATVIVLPEGCQAGKDPDNCQQMRGIDVFNSNQNTGFQTSISSTWSDLGQFDVDTEEALGYNVTGLFGLDKVSLGSAASTNALSISRQVVTGIAQLDYWLGMLPLGQAKSSFSSLSQQPYDSLLYQLRNNSQIPSFSYAYTAGAKYRLKSVFGSLILGGYDSTRFTPNANNFSFTFSTEPDRLLTVGVDSIIGTNTLQGTYSLTSGTHFTVIDSTVPHLWLPQAICDRFVQAFGLTYDPKTDLYLVNNTIHQQLLANSPNITFKLIDSVAGGATNFTNIKLPYAAFDLQVSYPYYNTSTNYFPIRRAANDSQFTLGRTLLQEAYLVVDYERARFTVSQAAFPDPLPAANVVTIVSPNEQSNSSNSSTGLGTGAIVGIAVGGAILLFAGIFAFFILRKQKAKQQRYELASNLASDANSAHQLHGGANQMKSYGPTELSGTPLTELASPLAAPYQSDQKTAVSINEEPAELHAESRTPITPRWEEVRVPRALRDPYELDAESSGSRSVSQLPSDDGYGSAELGLRSGVSPLTGHFQLGTLNPR